MSLIRARGLGNPGAVRAQCFWLALAALACLILTGCSRQTPSATTDVVAKIGTREIQVPEFQAWMTRRSVGTNLIQKEALLREMHDHFAALQRAEALGLDKDPALRETWENLLVSKLRERQLESQISNTPPSASQIESYYSNHLHHYTQPEMRRGAILFCEVNSRMPAERRAEITNRVNQARVKALAQNDPGVRGFGALAVEYSEEPVTRYKGGDIGWVTEAKADNRFDAAVTTALFALSQTNEVSLPIETPQGLYLVRLLEVRPKQVRSLEHVQSQIAHKLLLENRGRLESAWLEQLHAAFPLTTYTNVLTRVATPKALAPVVSDDPPSPR